MEIDNFFIYISIEIQYQDQDTLETMSSAGSCECLKITDLFPLSYGKHLILFHQQRIILPRAVSKCLKFDWPNKEFNQNLDQCIHIIANKGALACEVLPPH